MAAYSTFLISGVNVANYIKPEDIKISANDVDGPCAGRDLVAGMHRDRIGVKTRIDITCRDLKLTESQRILSAIDPVAFAVRYIDPKEGTVTKTMYCSGWNSTGARYDLGKDTIWFGKITFSLVEI